MPDENNRAGERIKSLRIEKGMSIEDLSRASMISEANLLSFEENKALPPLGNIISLAKAFDVSVGEVFGDIADSPFCIVRNDARKTVSRFNSIEGDSYGYSYESLGYQKKNRQMEPFLVTLTPGSTSPVEANQHIGEEIIFVLEGQVEVTLLDHKDILIPGDSIYYDSTMPHVISCHGDKTATILAVIYAKEERIIL
jgi:transcriptional regulator with XRE-family HTH domain